MELREDYAFGGTCAESLFGGNHLRMFRQNGTNHNTGALFLACVIYLALLCPVSYQISRSVSTEEVALLSFVGGSSAIYFRFQDVFESHNIVPNGYDIGR